MKTLGQINYEAALDENRKAGWLINDILNEWDLISPSRQSIWESAAQAVLDSQKREEGK